MHVTRVELENIKSYERGEFASSAGRPPSSARTARARRPSSKPSPGRSSTCSTTARTTSSAAAPRRASVRVTFQSDLDERQLHRLPRHGLGLLRLRPRAEGQAPEGKADVRKWLDQHLGVEPGTDLRVALPLGHRRPARALHHRLPALRRRAQGRLRPPAQGRGVSRVVRPSARHAQPHQRAHRRGARPHRRGRGAARALRGGGRRAQTAARARVEELTDSLAAFQREAEERERAVARFGRGRARASSESRAAADRLEVEIGVGRAPPARPAGRRSKPRAAPPSASARPKRTHRAHLEALEALRALEAERAERDRLRAEAADASRARRPRPSRTCAVSKTRSGARGERARVARRDREGRRRAGGA